MLKKISVFILSALLIFTGMTNLNIISNNNIYATTNYNNKCISSSGSHYLAIKSNGTILSWGTNSSGQLGNNSTVNSSTPVQVNDLTDVISVATGASHSVALKSDGTVWVWGNNAYYQLGNGTKNNSLVPIQVNINNVISIASAGYNTFAVKSDGTVWGWGSISSTPIQINNLSNIISVSANSKYALFLKSDGTVWGSGQSGSYSYQLGGNPDTSLTNALQLKNVSNVIAISAGVDDVLVLKSDGTVWDWGLGTSYQLGNGNSYSSSIPVKVALSFTDVSYISAGNGTSLVIKSNGDVYGWGNNSWGGLGVSGYSVPLPILTKFPKSIAVASANYGGLSVSVDGAVFMSGNGNPSIPAQIQGLSNIGLQKLDNIAITDTSSTSNSVTLNWNTVAKATSYEISIDNSTPIDIGNVTTYTQSNLQSNSSHTYKIRAKNIDTLSDWSNPITMFTTAVEPQKVIVNTATSKEVKVSVNGSINPVGTQYDFGAFQNGVLVKETGFTTNSTASIEGLTPNQTYDLKVATKSTNGTTTSFRTLGIITVPDNKATNGDLDVNVIVDPTITLTINTNSISFGNVSPLTASYELPNILVVGIQSNNVYTLSAIAKDDFIGSKGFKMPSSLLNVKEHNNNYQSLNKGVKTDLISNQAPTGGVNYNIDLKLNTDWQIKPDNYSNIINIAVSQL